MTESEISKPKKSKNKLAIILLSLLLCASLAGIGCLLYQNFNKSSGDAGATVTSYEGKSKEEIQALLDKQTEDSRMTISVNSQPSLKDGKLRVNVINDADNRFYQSFKLEQDGKVLYESGVIKTGETVEWCDAPDAHTGDATITVQALNKDTTKASGNPQSVQVSIVQG